MSHAPRFREISLTRKLRCEALNVAPTNNRGTKLRLEGLPDQCTTNGDPHPCGHVLCWTHRTRYDAGKPVNFVKSAATLALLFPRSP